MSIWTVRMSRAILKSHRQATKKIEKDQMKLDENKRNEAQIG